MNPDQLIERMLDGDRIVIVAPTWAEVPALSEQLWVAALTAEANGRLRVHRANANGRELIHDQKSGGWIRFRSARGVGPLRGCVTADLVLLPNDAGQDLLAEATVAVTATGGTVERWKASA